MRLSFILRSSLTLGVEFTEFEKYFDLIRAVDLHLLFLRIRVVWFKS